MTYTFTPAKREQAKARVGLVGPSGSGKTWTALVLAHTLGQKIAVIDTEHGSASVYAGEEYADGKIFAFDHLALTSFAPKVYVEAIHAAEAAGYDVIVVDSLSHAWAGKDGALEMVDRASVKSRGNSYVAWRDVTPEHNRLVDALVACTSHLIATMRSKTAYELVPDKDGKVVPRKIGLAPIQREGMDYEFQIVGEMDHENRLVVTKTRCRVLAGQVFPKPGQDLGAIIRSWLSTGEAGAVPDTRVPTGQTEARSETAALKSPADSPAENPSGASVAPGRSPQNGDRKETKGQATLRLMKAFTGSGLDTAALDDLASRMEPTVKRWGDLNAEFTSALADEVEALRQSTAAVPA